MGAAAASTTVLQPAAQAKEWFLSRLGKEQPNAVSAQATADRRNGEAASAIASAAFELALVSLIFHVVREVRAHPDEAESTARGGLLALRRLLGKLLRIGSKSGVGSGERTAGVLNPKSNEG